MFPRLGQKEIIVETRDLTKELQDVGIVPKTEDMVVGEVCVIKETNRQVLVDTINSFINTFNFGWSKDKSYLSVSLSAKSFGCKGGTVDYATEADVPYYSVPCPCGNPKHWLIKYEDD